MQYHAIPCNTLKYHNIPCHTKQYWAIPYNMTKHHTVTQMQYGNFFLCLVTSVLPWTPFRDPSESFLPLGPAAEPPRKAQLYSGLQSLLKAFLFIELNCWAL